MKALISSFLFLIHVQFSSAETWRITDIKTVKTQGRTITITVIAKNVSDNIQVVPASSYDGEEGLARPNSFLWPQRLSMKDAMSVLPSHYYTHNSRSCHEFKEVRVPAGGEITFRMSDNLETIGKRLLLVFDSNSLGSQRSIVGIINVPEPKLREQDAVPNR